MNETTEIQIAIAGMHCASCVGRVERALSDLPGVEGAVANLATETVRLRFGEVPDLAEVARTLETRGYPAQTQSIRLDVASMTCGGCVGRVERALKAVPGVIEATGNLANETVTVTILSEAVTAADLAEATKAAGYPSTPSEDNGTERSSEDRHGARAEALRRKAVLAAALTLPVFILEMGSHLIPALHMAIAETIGIQASWILQFLLTSAVLLGPGREFFRSGFPALFRGAPDMNSLVAIGTGAAWTFSTLATFLPGALPDAVRAVYFEAAAVIVTLILVGRWLEARAKGRAGAAIQRLLGLQVREARVERDGRIETVPVSDLVVGDRVVLGPGARVPTDGVVLSGASHLDESMMTGEAIPVGKGPGDDVTGGTVNGSGELIFEVSRVGKDTTLAQIVRLVEDAQAAKLPIQSLVDRVTLWFVPFVLCVAVLTLVIWLAFGSMSEGALALVAAVSVLIIACPCAMGLATPTSIMVGTGRAAEMGVFFRQGIALQALSDVDVVAFDKTGTLTEGKPALTDTHAFGGYDPRELTRLVAAIEARSEHPLAQAFSTVEEGAIPKVTDFTAVPGRGATAIVDGRTIHVGSPDYIASLGVETDAAAAKLSALQRERKTVFLVAVDGTLAGLFAVSDPIRRESAEVVAALKASGVDVALVSGDAAETAEAVGRTLGIEHVMGAVRPDGKVAALEALRKGGRRLAFVGDGINDAPALASADVGIAVGTGTDVAIEVADVVLMSHDLRGVLNAVEVSRRTMQNIRQNLIWAFGYNVALIPVAAGALYPAFGLLLSPIFAAAAMALSSVSVLTNALRLRRIGSVSEVVDDEKDPLERGLTVQKAA